MEPMRKATMAQSSIRGVLADTCFWIAAFDPSDNYHPQAAQFLRTIRKGIILMPWPIMYETLGTRTVRKEQMRKSFASLLTGKVHKINDVEYREQCLKDALTDKRPLSLVDRIVRRIIQDRAYRITQLLTFNQGDFYDVCGRETQIWPPNELISRS
jgi:predicted nucleic acid-binding protein